MNDFFQSSFLTFYPMINLNKFATIILLNEIYAEKFK